MSALGHKRPRRSLGGAAASPLITDKKADGLRVRYGPLTDSCAAKESLGTPPAPAGDMVPWLVG
jgi:hypothetical protein